MSTPDSILACTSAELRSAFAADGIEGYRARQVLRWLWRRGVREFDAMSDLGRATVARLHERWRARALGLESVHLSDDGTRKLVLATDEGLRLEAVIIPERDRRTLCLSSQIGCSLDCSFCATGRMRLRRNLGAEEIVDQVLHAQELLADRGERLTHLVFMGMGEPLLNLAAVVQAIRVASDPDAGGFSPRRITVSTAGVVPMLAELGRAVRCRLAVSLHATTDAVRDELVPLNRRFPIAALLDACRRYPLRPRDRISFEYVLIRDVNDTHADARRLVGLLHGLRAKVNVIPLNEHPLSPYRRPEPERVERFVAGLARSRAPVSVRRSRGDDVFAACGQLAMLSPGSPKQVQKARGRASDRLWQDDLRGR